MQKHWLVLLVLGLALSACSRSNPSNEDKSWTATEQGMDNKQDQQHMQGKGPMNPGQENEQKPLTGHIIEWKSVGLTDDQIRRKIQEAAENPDLVPGTGAFTEDELEQLRNAGVSDDLISFFKGLEFKGAAAPAAGGPSGPAPTADAPAAAAPAADAPAADAPPPSP